MQRKSLICNQHKTARFAESLAPLLNGGDTILVNGVVGAGKTHFVRLIIQSRLHAIGIEEDIPSPTFTLVQTYDLEQQEIWHADLYRLSSESEVFELGLEDAFASEICFVEWPDRLGNMAPKNALTLDIKIISDNTREFYFSWESNHWEPKIEKAIKDMNRD